MSLLLDTFRPGGSAARDGNDGVYCELQKHNIFQKNVFRLPLECSSAQSTAIQKPFKYDHRVAKSSEELRQRLEIACS